MSGDDEGPTMVGGVGTGSGEEEGGRRRAKECAAHDRERKKHSSAPGQPCSQHASAYVSSPQHPTLPPVAFITCSTRPQ